VHGIGEQGRGDTLLRCSEALQKWLNTWIKGAGAGNSKERASISDPLLRPAPDDFPAPAHTQLSFQRSDSDERSTWLLAESYWALVFAPPKYFDVGGCSPSRGRWLHTSAPVCAEPA
jgi:hypothetical protein